MALYPCLKNGRLETGAPNLSLPPLPFSHLLLMGTRGVSSGGVPSGGVSSGGVISGGVSSGVSSSCVSRGIPIGSVPSSVPSGLEIMPEDTSISTIVPSETEIVLSETDLSNPVPNGASRIAGKYTMVTSECIVFITIASIFIGIAAITGHIGITIGLLTARVCLIIVQAFPPVTRGCIRNLTSAVVKRAAMFKDISGK